MSPLGRALGPVARVPGNGYPPTMRDTEVLRRRLWAQIGLPLATAALLSACDGAASAPTTAKGPGQKAQAGEADGPKTPGTHKADPGEARPEARTNTNAAAGNYVPPARIEDIPEGEFDYFGPGRDPYANHDEEEGCPKGDWCGSPEDARKFSIDHVPEQLGCPSKIIAKPQVANSLDKKDKRWEGFSFHPMMQGRLMSSVTKETRESGKAKDTCCYHWFEYCSGRPLLDGEEMVLAELQPGSTWSCNPAEVAAPSERPDAEIPPELRARIGELWVEDARMEHAAIGAFMRATLELMAMAAPSELLAGVQEAAQDEVVHAQRCFGLAARFAGVQREPGPLPTLEPRVGDPSAEADWTRLALDTFVEGCVGETIAALVARRSLRHCEDPATRATLEQIADEEGRHAGLAWQTIAWILEASGDHSEAVVEALRAQAGAQAEAAAQACGDDLPPADPQAQALAVFGRLDRRTELLARRDAWDELILPTLEAMTPPTGEGPEAWA